MFELEYFDGLPGYFKRDSELVDHCDYTDSADIRDIFSVSGAGRAGFSPDDNFHFSIPSGFMPWFLFLCILYNKNFELSNLISIFFTTFIFKVFSSDLNSWHDKCYTCAGVYL